MHHHLKQSDRACIAALLRKGYSYSAIARVLEVHPSTISREVRRNSIVSYRVHHAQRCARLKRANARTMYRTIDTNDVQRAVARLNNRPRKRLNYLTPREFLEKEGVQFR